MLHGKIKHMILFLMQFVCAVTEQLRHQQKSLTAAHISPRVPTSIGEWNSLPHIINLK